MYCHAVATLRWSVAGICSHRKQDCILSNAVFVVLALSIFPASRPASIVDADELNFCVRDGNRWTLIAINTNYVDGFCPSFICQSALRSNSLWIIAPFRSCVNPSFSLRSKAQHGALYHARGAGDPYRIRTDVKGVRGLCLNHLTNGPLVHLHGLEPGTH